MSESFKQDVEELASELAEYGWFVLPYRNYELGAINLFVTKYKCLRGIMYYGTYKKGSKELETLKIVIPYSAYKEFNYLLRRYGFLVYYCIKYVNDGGNGIFLCRHFFFFDSIEGDLVKTRISTIVERGLRLSKLG